MRKILAMAAVMLLGTSGAWAIGTLATTRIDNNATLTFSAGGVLQPEVNATLGASGSADSFVVDKKIDMILEIDDTNHIPGALGQSGVVTTYTFQNEGNSDERFHFHVTNQVGGNSDNSDNDVVGVDTEQISDWIISCNYTDQNGAAQTLTGAANTDIVIFTDVDTNATCTVSVTLPTGVADGSVMNIELNATAYSDAETAEIQTAGADDASTVQVVFADGMTIQNGSTAGNLGDSVADDNASSLDGLRDGSDVAVNGYIIQVPVLTATKVSCVIDDPVNNTTNPKRIPGATIGYLIDVVNGGSAAVSDLNVTDTLNNAFVSSGGNIVIANVEKDINVGTGNACNACASGSISDTALVHTESAMTTTLQGVNINASDHSCLYFEVEIK